MSTWGKPSYHGGSRQANGNASKKTNLIFTGQRAHVHYVHCLAEIRCGHAIAVEALVQLGFLRLSATASLRKGAIHLFISSLAQKDAANIPPAVD
jgi:hypothetical protein